MEASEAEFESWVHARSASLARTAYLLTGDFQFAEDLVQDTLARVAHHWRRVAREGNPDAYARRVMHNLAIDRWRRRGARPAEVLTERDPEIAPHTNPGTHEVERGLLLREAIARLTPKQRSVLVLRYYEDLTEARTAEVLGCSVGTVKSQTSAALERLRARAPDLLSVLSPEGTR